MSNTDFLYPEEAPPPGPRSVVFTDQPPPAFPDPNPPAPAPYIPSEFETAPTTAAVAPLNQAPWIDVDPSVPPITAGWDMADIPPALMSTTYSLGAKVLGAMRYLSNDPDASARVGAMERNANAMSEFYAGQESQGAQLGMSQSLFSGGGWHTLGLRAIQALPWLVSILGPGAAFGATGGGAAGATFLASLIGGTESLGDVADRVYGQLDKLTDAQIAALPAAQKYHDMGLSDAQIAEKAKGAILGAKPLIGGVVGAIATAFGGPGVILKGISAGSRLGSAALGVGLGGVTGFGQGYTNAALINEALTGSGAKDVELTDPMQEGIETAAMSSALGVLGFVHTPEGHPAPRPDTVDPAVKAALTAAKPGSAAGAPAGKPGGLTAPPALAFPPPAAAATVDELRQHMVDLGDAVAAYEAQGIDPAPIQAEIANTQARIDAAAAAPPKTPPVVPDPSVAAAATGEAPPVAPATVASIDQKIMEIQGNIAARRVTGGDTADLESQLAELRNQRRTIAPPDLGAAPPAAPEAIAATEGAGTPPVTENAPVAAPVAGEAPIVPVREPPVESIPPTGAEPTPDALSPATVPPTDIPPAPKRGPVVHEEAPSALVKEQIATGEKAAKVRATAGRRKAAAAERAAKVEAGAAGPEARATSHKSTAIQAERAAREGRIKNVFEAEVTKGKEWPDKLPETVPEMEALYKHVMKARQEILKAGVPPKRIRDAATDHDAWARETLDLASTMDKGNRDRVRDHIEDYLGRLGPAKKGDFKPMRAERRSAAAQKVLDKVNKGAGGKDVDTSLEGLAAGQTGAATEILPAKSVGESGGTPTTKFEKAPAGRSRVVKGKEAEAIAKRLGLPMAKAVKKTAGEAGTTTGKTEPVTSQVTKAVGPKGVEVLAKRPKRIRVKPQAKAPPEAKPAPKAETKPRVTPGRDLIARIRDMDTGEGERAPPKETTRSHAAHDDAIEKTAAHAAELVERLQGLKNLRGEEKNGKRKAELGKQVKETIAELATVRAHHANLVGSAALKDAMAGRAPEGANRPSAAEIKQAYDARRHWMQRVEDLSGKPERKADLLTAQTKLAEAEDVLRRAAGVDRAESPVPTRGIRPETSEEGRAVVGEIRRAATHAEKLGVIPKAVNSHPFNENGIEQPFKSVIDTTVGKLMEHVNLKELAHEIFGSEGDAPGLPGLPAVPVLERIIALSKDTPVYFGDAARDAPQLDLSDEGYAMRVGPTDHPNGFIYYDLKKMQGGDIGVIGQQAVAVTAIHEAVHELTVHAYHTDPRFKYAVDELFDFAKFQAEKRWGTAHVENIYGFTKPWEFITEAFSNKSFHRMLREMKAPEHIVEALGLDKVSRAPSVFDAFLGYIHKFALKMLGYEVPTHTVLDALWRAVDEVTSERAPSRGRAEAANRSGVVRAESIVSRVKDSGEWMKRAAAHAIERPSPEDQHGIPWNLRFVDGNYIARAGDRFFGEKDNPVREIVNGWQRTHVDSKLELAKAMPLVERLMGAEREYGSSGEFSDLIDVAHDATNSGVHPDKPLTDPANKHVGKNSLSGAQARYRHADIARRYNELPETLKTLYQDMVKFFAQQQNKLNLQTIRNQLLEVAGIKLDAKGEALANRIFLNKMTEADEALLGDLAEPLRRTNILGKLDGPYVPLIRRGDFVVTATAKIPKPDPSTNSVQIKDENGKPMSVYEFGAGNKTNKAQARKDAIAYAEKLGPHAEPRSVWVDEKTGKLYHEGEEPPVKVLKNDPNADQRFRVYVQDQHTEFVDNLKVAERRRNELVASGAFEQVDRVAVRAENNFPQSGWLASQLRVLNDSMEKRPGFKELPAASQFALKQVMREATMRLYSSTRIETRGIPRRHVAGHGREIINDITDYARASSGRLAQLRHAPAINEALIRMSKMAGDDHPQKLGRSAIANEINKRAVANNGYQEGGKFTRAVQRMMGMQFTIHLATPSHTIVNLTQHPLLTTTTLAARHGWLKTVSQTRKAFRDVGYFKQLGKGIKDTGRAIVGKDTPYDYITAIRDSLPANEKELFDKAVMEGALDPDAGLEVAQAVDRLNASTPLGELTNKADAMLAWSQAVAHHLPRAAEVLNRAPALLAAYRLERMTKGASHAEAMQYAIDTVHKTQFNYSPVNRAPFFNHPLARLLLQFKQYPQHLMQLVGENIGKIIRKEMNPGDRAEAIKALVNVVGANVLMAGTLGLPTEIFKVILTAAGPILGAVGVKVPTWDEVEDQEQRLLIGMFGQTAGVGISRGIPAMLGVDMNPNLGWQNMFTYGAPASAGADDVFKWTADQVGGAPWSTIKEYYEGLGHIAAGEYLQAAENYVPFKFATNLSKAWRETMYGKVNPAGRTTFEPYNLFETGVRAIGFKPTRESLAGERSGAFLRSQRDYSAQRTTWLNDFFKADQNERMRMMGRINEWNRGRPPDEQLTFKQLQDYVRQRGKEKVESGFPLRNPRDERTMRQLEGYYGKN